MSPNRPRNWTQVRLGDLADVKHGFAFAGEFFTDQPGVLVLVTPGNFAVGGGFQKAKLKYYAPDAPVPDEFRLQPGDLILTMTDLSKASDTLGYPALVPEADSLTYLHNQRIGKVVERVDAPVDRRFLNSLFRSPSYRHHVLSTASGTTVKHTSPARICDYEFQLPPISEQRRIAGVLGALDDKIEHNEALGVRVREVADLRFRQVFVASSRGRRRTLGEIVSVSRDAVAPAEQPAGLFEHFSIPAFDIGRRATLDVGAAILSRKTRLPKGDVILFSKLNPARRRIWWARPSGAGEAVCSGEFLVLVPTGVPASFLYASLRNDSTLYEEILSHATGTTGSRQRVKPSEVLACSLLDARSDELESYDSFARPLYELEAALLSESGDLGAIRDALLPKLVSGAIRVPDGYDPDYALGTVAEAAGAAIP